MTGAMHWVALRLRIANFSILQRANSIVPITPLGYIHLSDHFVRHFMQEMTDSSSLHQAIEVLEKALAHPVVNAEKWDVGQRLANARELHRKGLSGFGRGIRLDLP